MYQFITHVEDCLASCLAVSSDIDCFQKCLQPMQDSELEFVDWNNWIKLEAFKLKILDLCLQKHALTISAHNKGLDQTKK